MMSLYTYYCIKDFPTNKNIPKNYIEIRPYEEKTYVQEIEEWVYGEVGYNRVLTVV